MTYLGELSENLVTHPQTLITDAPEAPTLNPVELRGHNTGYVIQAAHGITALAVEMPFRDPVEAALLSDQIIRERLGRAAAARILASKQQ